MKRFLLFLMIPISFSLMLASCESVSEAQKAADDFYAAVGSADYERAFSMFDESMSEEHGKEKIIELMTQRNKVWGAVGSYSKYGFHTSTNNGTTIVVLKFKVTGGAEGTVYEKLEFIERNGEYKIIGYFFNPDQSKIDAE